MPTGDILVLAIVGVVLLAVVGLGCAVLWDAANPGEWTAGGWSAVGTWFAGTATLLAVGVALWQARQAHKASDEALLLARRQHTELLRHEIWKTDIAAAVSLLRPLTDLRSAMFGAEAETDSYRAMLEDIHHGRVPEPDDAADPDFGDGPGFWDRQHQSLYKYLSPVKDVYVEVRMVGISVRSPDLTDALEETGTLVELIGDQLHTWSIQAGKGEELADPLDRIRDLSLDARVSGGVLPALAHRAEQVLREAVVQSNAVDPWADEGTFEGSM